MFEQKFRTEGKNSSTQAELRFCKTTGGLKQVFMDSKTCENVVRNRFCSAFDMIRSSYLPISFSDNTEVGSCSQSSCETTYLTDEHVLAIVKIYGERILLKESDRKPRVSRRRRERRSSVNTKDREQFETNGDWQGPASWDLEFGGDGCPKFLCDVMVEGLARHLRCVGIDAAVPFLKKPEPSCWNPYSYYDFLVQTVIGSSTQRKKGATNTRCQALEAPVFSK